MISTTEVFDAQIQKDSRTFRAQFLSDTAPTSGEIKKITINKGACGENFTIGSTFVPYVDAVIIGCGESLENKELLLQIGVLLPDESIEFIDIGYFTVTKPNVDAYQTTFTAVGRIASKLNCEPNSLPMERTLANIVDVITETTGVKIVCNGVVLNDVIEADLDGLTCRELLGVIATTIGGFVTEDNKGNVVISKYSTQNKIPFNGDRTAAYPEFNDYDYTLSGVEVIVTPDTTDENGNIKKGVSYKAGNPIRQTLNMPYMTDNLFSTFAENVIGYTYRPGTVHLSLGDPRLEPWDCIEFTDVKDRVYVVPCLNIVHTFDGGVSTTITAPGSSTAEETTQVKGPITIQIENIKKETVDMINNISVGGTNLLRNSQTLIFEDYYFGKTLEIVHDGENVLHIAGVALVHDGEQTLLIKDVSLVHDGNDTVTIS